MPGIETPFFTDIRPFEELSVATKLGETAAEATERGGAGGFHRNRFSAMIGHLCFLEDPPLSEDGEAAEAEATAGKKRGRTSGGKAATGEAENPNDAVRVSLIARVGSAAPSQAAVAEGEAPRPGSTQTITLASWTFDSLASQQKALNEARKSSKKEDGGAAAGTQESPRHLACHSVCLRVPLMFRSDAGAVQSLAVVAHTVPEDVSKGKDGTPSAKQEAPSASSHAKKLKPYVGRRRFAVRLCGMQQTELTDDQVVLLSS